MDPIPNGLREYLLDHYNEGELRDLCHDLGIDYDILPVGSKADKARGLIEYSARHGRMEDLLTAAQRERRPFTPVSSLATTFLERMPLDALPLSTALPPGSLMPLHRNPLFVGRAEDLMALARILKGSETVTIGQTVAITGIGGIGKTNLATEFVHRYGPFFAGGVFWLSFADSATIPTEIAACGGVGGLNLQPDFATLSLPDQVAAVIRAWQSPIPRLLIFDNCDTDDADMLVQYYRPTTGGCRVLLTTRQANWEPSLGIQTLALGVLKRAESVTLLRYFRAEISDGDANELADELGDLPLALHLAGNFLQLFTDLAVVDYLAELRDISLLEHESLQGIDVRNSPTNHMLHVGRTFALSYQRLDIDNAIDDLARMLLARAAYCAPGEPLPREIVFKMVDLSDKAAERQAQRAIIQLSKLGLVTVNTDSTLTLHRLIAAFVQSISNDPTPEADVERVLITVAYELRRQSSRALLSPLLPHLYHTTERALLRADEQAATLATNFACCLQDILADYITARQLLERAIAIYNHILGPHHPNTANALNDLASLSYDQGHYDTAYTLHKQALTIREQILGSQHVDTATTLHGMALSLLAIGDRTSAREAVERAHAIYEQALGGQHIYTATARNTLAGLLSDLDDYAAARPIYEEILTIFEREFGSHHPNTATALNNLAKVLKAQGDHSAARVLYERALAIDEQELGEHHPHTSAALMNLAMILHEQGDHSGATSLLNRTILSYEHIYGAEHPTTAAAHHNLGGLLYDQGNYAAARLSFEHSFAIREQTLGSQHRDTALSLFWIGMCLEQEGNLSQSIAYKTRAAVIFRKQED